MGRVIFYIVTLVVPLLLWLPTKDKSIWLSDPYMTMTTIGQILGLWGIMLFSGQIILSGKYTWVDRLFGGLDRVYLLHKRTGRYVAIMLLSHFLLLTLRYWQFSFGEVVRFAFDFANIPVNYGRIALVGLLVIVGITLYYKLEYESKKKLHRWLGFFLLMGAVHAFMIPSDIAVSMPLRVYILGSVGLTLISFAWTSIIRSYLAPGNKFKLLEVNPLKGEVTELVMRGPNNLSFVPGQFMFTKFKQKGFPYEEHPFSITDYKDGVLRISAKQSGDYTKQLPKLEEGAVAQLLGPFGGFSLDKVDNKEQVWIAGGIGITPFMAMARFLVRNPENYKINLIHSVTNEDEATFKEELEEISKSNSNFSYKLWITDDRGRLSVEKLRDVVELANKDIFICGPAPMIQALSSQLRSVGVPRSRIHFELFSLF